MNTRHIATIALVVTIITAAGAIIISRLPAQISPAVSCNDSDGGYNYTVKGTATGIYGGAVDGYHAIYGQEPNPMSPKQTTENYSTYIDHCATNTQLNEGFCDASTGKMSAFGYQCPYGCGDGVCLPSPDMSPSITLSAQATSPATWRPGGRGYFSWSVTDDKALQSVIITTSPMMYSGPQIDETWKCQGKTSCEEKVYVIVPSNPGPQFVTVTATDSAGQTATKTVNFDAPACTISTDCGNSGIQWAGASYCEKNGWIENRIMQYGVAAACESGICNTESLPRFKQQCQDAQVCTFNANGETICIAQPMACSPNAQITSACMCGGTALNYPVDWRVAALTYCCMYSDGTFYTTSPGPCVASTSSLSSSLNSFSATTGGANINQQTAPSSGAATASSTPSAPYAADPAVISAASTIDVHPAAQLSSRAMGEGTARSSAGLEEKVTNKAELQREWNLLKGKVKTTKKTLASVERNIDSLEKKIDVKLRLLDRSKRKEVQKRVTAQIEQLEEKVASLEKKKEKLEQDLEEFRARWEEWRGMME